MKRLYFLLTFMTAVAFGAMAQEGYNWAYSIGAARADDIRDVVTDEDGNIYICGSFQGNANFGTQKVQTKGKSDGFVVKLNSKRKIAWIKQIGSMEDVIATDMVLDEDGNIYVAGSYVTDFTLYETAGDTTTEKGNASLLRDLFVISLDNDGNMIEVMNTGLEEDMIPNAIATTWDGGVYVSYTSTDPVTGDINSGIARLEFNDFTVWEATVTGNGVQEIKDIAVTDDGHVVGLGYFSTEAIITDDEGGMFNFGVSGNFDMVFIYLKASDGTHVDSRAVSNFNRMAGWTLETDGDMIYIGGWYVGDIQGGNSSPLFWNSFIWAVDVDFTQPQPFSNKWTNAVNGSGNAFLQDIKVTEDGLAMVGQYISSIEIDTLTLARVGDPIDSDIYGTILNLETGKMEHTHIAGSAGNDNVYAVAESNLSYVMAGDYGGNMDLDALSLNNRGTNDGFMAEVDLSGRFLSIESGMIELCERSEFELDYDLGGEYEDDNVFVIEMSVDAPFNNPIVFDTIKDVGQGTATIKMDDRLVGSAYLCRIRSTNPKSNSSPDFRLIVTKGPDMPVVAGKVSVREGNSETYGVGDNPGSTYEWTVEGGTITTGFETNTITVLWGKDGEGKVSCVETSEDGCASAMGSLDVTIKFPKSIASTLPNNIKVYPTVVSDQLIIENSSLEPINATLMSVDGQELTGVQNLSTNTSIDMASMAAGVYMLKVNVADQNYSVRVVKY